MHSRLVIIGLDGVPYSLLRDLSDSGVMPNFRKLREEGELIRMASSIPEVSSVSWSSIITGKNPGEHGVYGFTDIIEGTYTISLHNSFKLKAPPFWNVNNDDRFVVINVPSTYPARELNGFIVTGFVSPDLERSVYPKSYIDLLKKFGYKIDIDLEAARKSVLLLLKELYDTLDARVRLYRYLWDKLDWDVFIFVVTGSDRLGHFLWDAYVDDNHRWHDKFLEYFKVVDFVIGEINSKLGDDDNLIILSDHGMELKTVNVNLNTLLEREGFLRLGGNPNRKLNGILDGTKAFVLDPGRVYLNLEGRYPKGCVKSSEVESVIDDLTSLFYDLRYNGERVIDRVYRKEDIYKGPYLESAPDLVLVSNSGFNLSAGLFREKIFEKDDLTGMHNQDAFFYVKGHGHEDLLPDNLCVEDVVRVLKFLRR